MSLFYGGDFTISHQVMLGRAVKWVNLSQSRYSQAARNWTDDKPSDPPLQCMTHWASQSVSLPPATEESKEESHSHCAVYNGALWYFSTTFSMKRPQYTIVLFLYAYPFYVPSSKTFIIAILLSPVTTLIELTRVLTSATSYRWQGQGSQYLTGSSPTRVGAAVAVW